MSAALLAVPAAAAPAPVVTLITGDRLTVNGDTVTRLPSPGRDDVPLVTRTIGGHLQVVPADVLGLLGADRLDPRLFDVTARPAGGSLPLVITLGGDPGAAAAVRAAAGRVPVRDLSSIDALAVRVDAADAAATWKRLAGSPYRKIWLDGTATPSIDVTVPLVGAPAAWAAGWTGRGVGVGVLDTGIDAAHPDLAVAEAVDFTGEGDVDRAGHGTHVASIIAGTGAASAGRFRGMAPGARLFSAKVCGAAACAESAILAGMQWAARDQQLRVVNLSFGRPDEPGDDLLELAVGRLTARYGTLFVAAAGNEHGPVTSPASAEAALAVGASTRDDTVAAFSASGPGAGALKPDLVAPGADIVAARSGDSRLPRAGGRPYTRLSGTSVAAPHVAGAAAILAEQHPQWAAAAIKAALTGSATPLAGAGVDRAGTGRLDVAKAVTAPVRAEEGSVLLGAAGRHTVTYLNSGAEPVTLALSLPAGAPLRLSADSVTVPAAGSATVTAEAGEPGRWTGRWTGVLTATAAGLSVRTAVGVDLGGDRPTLTVRYLDRSGATARRVFGTVLGPESAALPPDGGSVSLPAGTYTLDAKVFDQAGVTLLSRPRLDLRRDTVLTLDARDGRPVLAGQTSALVRFRVAEGGGSVRAGAEPMYAAQLGPGSPALHTDVTATWPDRSAGWAITGHLTAPPVADVRVTAGPPGYRRFAVEHGTAPITRFELTVSYDSGRSWQRPMVIRVGDRGLAAVRPGPASVRIVAEDAAGNRIERTVTPTG